MRRIDRRRTSRGQALLIFALSGVVLFALIGLAVDAGVSYAKSEQLERASASAALAAVTYMPDKWDAAWNASTSPPNCGSYTPATITVQCEAVLTAQKNGFNTTGLGGTNSVVTVAEVDASGNDCDPTASVCAQNRVRVRISATVTTSFLKLLGFGSHDELRSSVSEYLRPITITQSGGQVGSDLSSLGCNGTLPCTSAFFVRTEGWGVDRGQGDAFTPNPNIANADGSGPNNCWNTTPSGCNGNNASPDFRTNGNDTHSLSAIYGTEVDYAASPLNALRPAGPAGTTFVPAQRGGYNFDITVPAGINDAVVQVFNPNFAPDCNFKDGSASAPAPTWQTNANYNYAEGDSMACGDSNQNDYSTMGYTLYKVPNVFQHSQDVPLSTWEAYPIDAKGVANGHGAESWRPIGTGGPGAAQSNPRMPSYFHNWVDVGTAGACIAPQECNLRSFWQTSAANYPMSAPATGAQHYRLRVDTLDVAGNDPQTTGLNAQTHKGMAVRVVHQGGAACATCQLGALDDLAIYTNVVNPAGVGNTVTFPLQIMAVPPEYRGQNVSVYLFDPGDIGFGGLPAAQRSNVMSVLDEKGAIADAAGTFWNGPSLNYTGFTGFAAQPVTDCPVLPSGKASINTQCNSGPTTGLQGLTNIYNSTWLRYDVKIPAAYNPGCGMGFPPECAAAQNPSNWIWSLQYLTNGGATDTVTVSVGFGGSPVHLIGS